MVVSNNALVAEDGQLLASALGRFTSLELLDVSSNNLGRSKTGRSNSAGFAAFRNVIRDDMPALKLLDIRFNLMNNDDRDSFDDMCKSKNIELRVCGNKPFGGASRAFGSLGCLGSLNSSNATSALFGGQPSLPVDPTPASTALASCSTPVISFGKEATLTTHPQKFGFAMGFGEQATFGSISARAVATSRRDAGQLPPQCTVIIEGLQESPEFNGLAANIVRRIEHEVEAYEIIVKKDGSTQYISRCNLKRANKTHTVQADAVRGPAT